MNANIMPNITVNYEFHRREYMTIRPWIKARLEEMDIDCEIRYDNESFFLVKSNEDVEAELSRNQFLVDQLIDNKRSAGFIQVYLSTTELCKGVFQVSDILSHEHAATILRPMLDTFVIFKKYGYYYPNQRILKWIDMEFLQMILRGMTSEEVGTIHAGVYYLRYLIDEESYTMETTFDEVRILIARSISDKEGSIEYLKENPMFISEDRITLNPRCFELDEKYWSNPRADHICRNYGAIDHLKRLDPETIDWDYVATFHRDIAFMEANLDRLELYNDISVSVGILWNDYMMPFIKLHLKEFDPQFLNALALNASAFEYLEQHQELVDDATILTNPNAVTYDYASIQADHEDLHRELHEYLYHPSRIQKWLGSGNDIENYLQ